MLQNLKDSCKKVWRFLWHSNHPLSWLADFVLAFVLIKFVFYPVLGWSLGTAYPIVAVVSGSMEHDGRFDEWWNSQTAQCNGAFCTQREWYERIGIEKEEFVRFPFSNGFNRGDLMIVYSPKKIKVGEVIVFKIDSRADPIIHRVVKIEELADGSRRFVTKGDHNPRNAEYEKALPENKVLGKAVARIPLLGWIKIGFISIARAFVG